MEFKCYKDKLYLIFLIVINLIFIFAILVSLIYSILFGIISFSFLLILFDWYFFSIKYILKNNFLEIRFILFKKVIDYSDIIEIKQTANTFSSFALSRQRLGIKLKGKSGYIYISPENEPSFMKSLLKNKDMN